jgi:hypothetical protein
MIFLPKEIIQQRLLGLVAGLQSADPAAPFEDGPPACFVRVTRAIRMHFSTTRALPPVAITPW